MSSKMSALGSGAPFDVQAIRAQFPALLQQVNQSSLVYLDSAATSQKPQCVIDALSRYYSAQNANVHRGSHSLTANATGQFEAARHSVANFLNAASAKEIIWTRGATEAINLIAQSYARTRLQPDDEILVGEMEHHANIVPWQLVAEQTGAKVVKIPITSECQLDLDALAKRLNSKCKILALAHITNVTGTRQPIEQAIELAHQHQAVVVVDGAQAVMHEKIDVQKLQADFYVFSGHKFFASAGIGALYGRLELLETMPPWHGGGKMVEQVSFQRTSFAEVPAKFEAGTPNVAGAIALATAIDWYRGLNHHQAEKHIHQLMSSAYHQLSQIEEVRIIGFQPNSSIISFVVDGVHYQDVATLLDQQGVALRAGNHCAHPLMDALGVSGTIRVSFAIYNTMQEVERLISALNKALDML